MEILTTLGVFGKCVAFSKNPKRSFEIPFLGASLKLGEDKTTGGS